MSRLRTPSTAPDEECIENGSKYWSQIDREGPGRSGTVWDEQAVACWRYRVRSNPVGRGWGNPFNKPDFAITDADGQAELVIRRVSFVPSVFHILHGNHVTGQIRRCSVLRNKYAVDIHGVNSWTFQMPLFTLQFYGDSETGTDIWVAVGPSKMDWKILIRPGVSDHQLVAALVFIHTEWWNCG